MNIDPANLLALLSSQVGQIAVLEQKVRELEAELKKPIPESKPEA